MLRCEDHTQVRRLALKCLYSVTILRINCALTAALPPACRCKRVRDTRQADEPRASRQLLYPLPET